MELLHCLAWFLNPSIVSKRNSAVNSNTPRLERDPNREKTLLFVIAVDRVLMGFPLLALKDLGKGAIAKA